MDDILISKLYKVKDLIKKSDEYLAFSELEEKLESSDEVAILAYKKDLAIVNYEDVLKHFDKSSNEAKIAYDDLLMKIDALNKNHLVKNYNEALTKLNILLNEVEEMLLGDLND